MDTHILVALAAAPADLTAKELTTALKDQYPDAAALKKNVNSLLYGSLKACGRVVEVITDKPAPLWKVVSKQVVLVDLTTAAAVEPILDGVEYRYFGAAGTADAPAGAILAANYMLRLAMALEKERCLGNAVRVVSENPLLQDL